MDTEKVIKNLNQKKIIITSISIISVLVLLIGGYFALKSVCKQKILTEYKDMFDGLKEIATYEDVDCNPFTQSVTIKNINFKKEIVKEDFKDTSLFIKELVISNVKEDKELQTIVSASLYLKGVKIKDKNETLEGDALYQFAYDKDKSKLDIKFYSDVYKKFALELDFSFGNVSKELIKELINNEDKKNIDVNKYMPFFLGITIDKIYIKYQDKGYTQYILEQIAKEQGLSVEEYKKMVIENIDEGLKKTKTELGRKLLEKFKALVEGKDKTVIIEITKKSGANTSFSTLMMAFMGSSEDAVDTILNLFDIKIK